MKNHIQLVFALMLAVIATFALAGCNEITDTTGTGSQTTETGTDTTSGGIPTTAIDEEGDVVMAFLHAGNIQTSTDKVEAAVSAYVRSKLGFGIEFKLLNVFDQTTVYTNWLVAGEEIDLINVAFSDPSLYINEKRVREISSLITETNTPNLFAELENHGESKVLGVDGKLYGIGTWESYAYTGYSYTIRKDVLEAAGLYGDGEGQYSHLEQITYSDLDRIFTAVRNVMPTTGDGLTVYPCSAIAGTQNYASGLIPFDPMGNNLLPLAVMLMDPVTGEFTEEVVNYYETDEYKEYVEWIGNAFENGYIHPDAAITTDWFSDFFATEQFVGVLLQTEPGIRYEWETATGLDLIQLPLSTSYTYFTAPAISLMIPSKSERPYRTMQFLDLLYSDEYLINLLQYGVEGEEWEFADQEHGLIWEASEGSHANYVIGGFWGDKSIIYQFVNADDDIEAIIAEVELINSERDLLQATAIINRSPASGFIYDTTSQGTRIRNIEANVLSKYFNTLSVGVGSKGTDGTFTGPGSTYAKFIEALTKAKMYLVVEDKQAQYDAWKSEQEG